MAEVKKAKKESKYKNEKVEYGGIIFDSIQERDFYIKEIEPLKLRGYKIELQKEFILQEGFEKKGVKYQPIKYSCDYYVESQDKTDVRIIEIKGFALTDYVMRKKMFEYKYQDLSITVIKIVPKYLHQILGEFTIEEKLDKALKVVSRWKKQHKWNVMRAEYMSYPLIEEIKAALEGKIIKKKRNTVKGAK